MDAIQVTIMRHGQTLLNVEEKVQGWADSFLTPQGIEGVKKTSQAFREKQYQFDKIFSSDSGRTLETSRIVCEAVGYNPCNMQITPKLREYNYGVFEGLPEQEMWKKILAYSKSNTDYELESFSALEESPLIFDLVAAIDRKEKKYSNTWYAETSSEYMERIQTMLAEIIADSLKKKHTHILLVSHGHTLGVLLNMLFPEMPAEKKRLANAAYATFSYDDEGQTYKLI